MRKHFSKSIFSGILLSIVAYCYATVNGSIVGTMLFSFGLVVIILYGLPLFTGDAGFVESKRDVKFLIITLFGNVLGCALGSLILKGNGSTIQNTFIENTVNLRILEDKLDFIHILTKAMCCGLIMTIATKFARQCKINGNPIYILPLLLGIPVFLLCGFFHSIVDAFYISYAAFNELTFNLHNVIYGWLVTVFGNLIGCNIPRMLISRSDF